MPHYFIAQSIYHHGEFCRDSVLAVDDDGYIMAVLPRSCAPQKSKAGASVVDLGCRILAPAWVDLQVNGCGGGLFNRDLNLPCLEKMLRSNLQNGTTSIQPTLITCADQDIADALAVIGQAKQLAGGSSKLWQGIMGMHLEGPYISAERRGAHPSRLVRPLQEAMLQQLEAAGRAGTLGYITVAPESVSPLQVARLAASGVTVALGHTEAPSGQLRALLLAGARCFTHLYNAMGGIHTRDPRTLSRALSDTRAYSSIIADGHHVAGENILIAQRLLKQRLFLVTDATATPDSGEDNITFGEQTCRIHRNTIRNQEGALAGSALTMKRAVEIMAGVLGGGLGGLQAALDMASANPVHALNPHRKYNQRIGSLAPGANANFIAFELAASKTSVATSKGDLASIPPLEIRNLQTWFLGQLAESL